MKTVRTLIMLAALILIWCHDLAAQPSAAGQPRLLIPPGDGVWLNPSWSPDGQYLAFTSDSYRGLWIARADGSQIRQISEADGVGFGFSWSKDSKSILIRPSEFRNMRRLQSIELININSGATKVLVEPSREIKNIPQWTNHNQHVAVVTKKGLLLVESGKAPLGRRITQITEPILFPLEGKVCRAIAGEKDPLVLADFGDKTIFNIRFSPENNKMAFQVASKGLYVINLDGSHLKHFGKAERPCWSPNGKYLIAMKTTDNGHTILSGNLYALDVDSGAEYNLTAHTQIIALSPSVSPDGKRIAFENPNDGGIYILELNQGF